MILRRLIVGATMVGVAVALGAAIGERDGSVGLGERVPGAAVDEASAQNGPAAPDNPTKTKKRQATKTKNAAPAKKKAKEPRQAAAVESSAPALAVTSTTSVDEPRANSERVAPAEITTRLLAATTAPPNCIEDGPANGAFLIRLCLTAPVSSTVTDDVTVAAEVEVLPPGVNPLVRRMVFYLDGAPLLTDYSAPYEFVLPSAKWADGEYLLEVEDLTRYVDPVTLAPFTTARASMELAFTNGNLAPLTNSNVFAPTQGRQPGAGESFLLVATGDGASGELAADAVADAINSWSPNLFLYLGDVYDDGRTAEFYNWYGTDTRWGQFRDVTNPTIGNHEYEPDAAPYFDFWDNVPHFYAFDTQGWHFIALDSTSNFGQEDPGSPQFEWLKADLATNTAICTVAYLHHPRYSIGTQEDRDKIDAIWRLLVDGGVDIVLTGHDHNYQRWLALDAAGAADVDGATQFVIGSGGHGIRKFDPARVGDPRIAAASDAPDARGALQLILGPRGADFAYVTSGGVTLDQGSLACNEHSTRMHLRVVAAQLDSLIPTGNRRTDDKIRKAVEHLQKADADGEWETDERPRADDGKVLDEMKKAAEDLAEIGSGPQGVQAALESLQGIGRELDTEAIAEAEAAAGSLEELGKAYEELAKADEQAAEADFEGELSNLKKAFEKARDSLANAPSPWTSGVGMRGRIGDAILSLRVSYPTGTSADDRIEHADEKLAEALALKWWDDEVRPSDSKGDDVLNRLKAALKELEDAKPRTEALHASLEEVVLISRDLARAAIDEAIAAGGKKKKIIEAEKQFAKGDAEHADGEYEKAGDKYKKALEEARDAL